MYLMHVSEHRLGPLYLVAHKPHHHITNPNCFSAFNGHVLDTLLMILLPLYGTALMVPASVHSYMAFGTIYSGYLMLVHSEFTHPWDNVARLLALTRPPTITSITSSSTVTSVISLFSGTNSLEPTARGALCTRTSVWGTKSSSKARTAK